jgi:hypothetical protein
VKVAVREFQPDDTDDLLPNIRQADRDECDALFGEGQLEDGLRKSIASSVLLWTYAVEDEVAAVFGVCPAATLMGEMGVPWLVGTPLIDRSRGAFVKLSPQYIREMKMAVPRLLNVVDVRNVKSIAWLKRMGFTLLDPVPAGPKQMPFHPFFLD